MSDADADATRALDRARRTLQRDEPADPAAIDTLMRAVHRRPLPRRARPRSWLHRRLDLSLSPLAAAALLLAAAGAGALVTLALGRDDPGTAAGVADAGAARQPGAMPAATGAAAGTVVVHFAMVAPDAREVALVGDFNGWSPTITPLRRATANGTWWVAVPLHAGRYTYAFLLDGRLWVPDPAAPLAPEDGFGRRNSVVVVTAS